MENNYYENTGKYQSQYDTLCQSLIPETNTIHGELLRATHRLSHDYYNNGNGNAASQSTEPYSEQDCQYCHGEGIDDFGDECEECCGTGSEEIDGDVVISEYYQKLIEFIEANIPQAKNICLELELFIPSSLYMNNNYLYNEKHQDIYNNLIDTVTEFILNNNNL